VLPFSSLPIKAVSATVLGGLGLSAIGLPSWVRGIALVLGLLLLGSPQLRAAREERHLRWLERRAIRAAEADPDPKSQHRVLRRIIKDRLAQRQAISPPAQGSPATEDEGADLE
jgi:hypothetical protein